jgi:restriction system protein
MKKCYQDLAKKRVDSVPRSFRNPEHLEFDFRQWVSPYTKGAHGKSGVMIVLQDWGSVDAFRKLSKEDREIVGILGRNPKLLTNRRLERLLNDLFGQRIDKTYVTNAFPYIKRGGISAQLPLKLVRGEILKYTLEEIRLVKPSKVFLCGRLVWNAFPHKDFDNKIGAELIRVPHPAARMSYENHLYAWRAAMADKGKVRRSR